MAFVIDALFIIIIFENKITLFKYVIQLITLAQSLKLII